MVNVILRIVPVLTLLGAGQTDQGGAPPLAPRQTLAQAKTDRPADAAIDPALNRDLKNPGFETGTDGWSIHVYGAQPLIQKDASILHGGEGALQISATQPSDTALGQEVMLRAGHWYRFRAWVRTKNLDPMGAPVHGTFQIQAPGGTRTIASGENHRGDTDWTEVSIEFEAPAGGRTRICPFFVGFGKGTGSAWFDDLSIREIDLQHEPIQITRERLPGKINPLQYGQFIEYLCDVVPSMWAEKLYDGSFEGLTPYKVAYLRDTDFKEQPWLPFVGVTQPGAATETPSVNKSTGRILKLDGVNHAGAEYSLDTNHAISGSVSQRITVKEKSTIPIGVWQPGLAVTAKTACQFSVYLRQEGIQGPVTVRLHRHQPGASNGASQPRNVPESAAENVLASCSFEPGTQWKKFQARLLASATDTNASLSITFAGPGTLWIDNASLMPDDNIGGWRRDVVEAVKDIKPGVIRFGGSALDDANLGEFEWKDTIGDPDKRKPFRAWGGLQPTGPGLEEIVQFCKLVDAEPLICVRVSKRGPQAAFEQVQYFNGSADTPMGEMRVKNGHAEPYRIKYWQVGNERAGDDYEASLAPICQAMRSADSSVVLLSSYPSEGVLRKAGDLIQYVCPHQYDCANLAACEQELNATRDLIRRIAPGKSIKVAVTEWNTTGGDWGPTRAKLWTLENALACSRYHNLVHRQADLVDIANRSNLTNSFCSGIIQTDNHRLYKAPTYYAQRLYATLGGTKPLKTGSTVAARVPDVSATLSEDERVLTIFAINATASDISRPLDFSAFSDRGQDVRGWVLRDNRNSGQSDVTNSFDDPDRISPVEITFQAQSPKFDYKFPALSLTVLQWKVQ